MKQPTPWWMWLLPLPVVWWAALLTAGAWQPGMDLLQLMAGLSTVLQRPWDIRWTQYSGRCLLLFTLAYAVGIGMALSNTTATRRGEEHGSARWGDVFSIARRYRDKRGGNLILTQHFSIGWDGYRHKHNINVLVVGGSGAGKTRGYCVPNILEAAGRDQNAPPCSIVCSDPKSEVLRKTGALLIARGYEVRVLDLTSPAASFCYNPLRYIQSDKDALRMIDTLIQATTPPDSKSSDPFWVKSETALLQALVLYLVHEAPEEEQNLPMVMEMLQAAEVREEDDEYESPLDMLFSRLEMRDPESIALKQYRVYKMAAGKIWLYPTAERTARLADRAGVYRTLDDAAGRLCQRRRADHRPGYRLGGDRHIRMAASTEFYDHFSFWLPERSVHRRGDVPQRYGYRRSGGHAHPCGRRRHGDHCQRRRPVGWKLWLLH